MNVEIESRQETDKRIVYLNTLDIIGGIYSARLKYSQESIDELAQSIKRDGMITPIQVRQSFSQGEPCYVVVIGEKRFAAAKQMNLRNIPAEIIKVGDLEAFRMAFIEQLSVEELWQIHKIYGLWRLLMMTFELNDSAVKAILTAIESNIKQTSRLQNKADLSRTRSGQNTKHVPETSDTQGFGNATARKIDKQRSAAIALEWRPKLEKFLSELPRPITVHTLIWQRRVLEVPDEIMDLMLEGRISSVSLAMKLSAMERKTCETIVHKLKAGEIAEHNLRSLIDEQKIESLLGSCKLELKEIQTQLRTLEESRRIALLADLRGLRQKYVQAG